MSIERRRLRSRRARTSVVLLAGASLVVTSAVLLVTLTTAPAAPVLVAAAVSAVVLGIVAARLLSDELAQTRRDWSGDRAQQAKAYQRILSERTREQAGFATVMTERLTRRDADLLEVRGALRLSEARTNELRVRLDAEKHRADELDGTVAELITEREQVEDALAVWDGADVPTIVDLLNWEQAATAASTREAGGAQAGAAGA